MSAIVAEHATKRFPGEQSPAVNDVSFTVEKGSLVVLIGPSGCGKTTLLKMINRLYEPTEGRILIDGVEITSVPVTQLRRQIGYVIQQSGLFPHMRIEKNIAVVPELLGWEKPRIDARIDELLDLIGLPREYRKRFPRQLSGGQQQRVGLARALAADPALMLMDEPFGAIDAITRLRLQDELIDIQRRLHKTILFVTHDMEEALRLADKIVIMRSGQIVQYDTPLNIVTRPADAFVEDLIGSSDMLRRLSLLRVDALLDGRLTGERGDGDVTVRADDNLRSALSSLLASGSEAITVVGADDRPLGRLTFEDIQASIGTEARA